MIEDPTPMYVIGGVVLLIAIFFGAAKFFTWRD